MVRKANMPIQKFTPEIITAAILGFEEQKRHIDSKIAELRAMLPGGPGETAVTPVAPAPASAGNSRLPRVAGCGRRNNGGGPASGANLNRQRHPRR